MTTRNPIIWLSVGVLCSALAIGCGGSGSSSKTTPAANRPATTSTPAEVHGEQVTAVALAACRRAVSRPASLSAATKREIGELCDRINDVVEDNEATVRAVCQELAHAAASPSESTGKSIFSDCYAEYAKTIK